ncbi:MAG: DUF488 domain-containing protein [Nitrospirae bacterium]|nr:DUF488 domain-containing protein [Nitrospirota bacterium]
MKIYTIGFSKKTAETFFMALRGNAVRQLVDIRENNTSQLAGFTKKEDLRFFLRELVNVSYIHIPELAPDKEMRTHYKSTKNWERYTEAYLSLIEARGIIGRLKESNPFITPFVLLCSEPKPEKCHRRLAAEILKEHIYSDGEIVHL